MEQIKQTIRSLAAKVNMQPKVFVMVCAVFALVLAGGALAALRPKSQVNTITTQTTTSTASTQESGHDDQTTESEDNGAITEEYRPQNPNEEPKDSPTLEIKMDGSSNKHGKLMIRTENGQSTKTVKMEIISTGVDLADCNVTQATVFDDESIAGRVKQSKAVASQTIVLEDGHHDFTVDCKKEGVTSSMDLLIADWQPEHCKGFSFSDDAVTAHSVQDVQSGIVGTWKGCVTQPWLPTYEVVINFKADGTYDSYSDERLDGQYIIGLYYGTDSDNAAKKYQLTNFAGDTASGNLTIFFENSNTTVTNNLDNVKLMGNKLSFSFKHLTKYGPLTLQLTRQ